MLPSSLIENMTVDRADSKHGERVSWFGDLVGVPGCANVFSNNPVGVCIWLNEIGVKLVNCQKEIVGISGNRSDLFSRQRKRDDLRHLSLTLADWSEAIRSTFGNQSVIAWILIDAVMIVAVAQL